MTSEGAKVFPVGWRKSGHHLLARMYLVDADLGADAKRSSKTKNLYKPYNKTLNSICLCTRTTSLRGALRSARAPLRHETAMGAVPGATARRMDRVCLRGPSA